MICVECVANTTRFIDLLGRIVFCVLCFVFWGGAVGKRFEALGSVKWGDARDMRYAGFAVMGLALNGS